MELEALQKVIAEINACGATLAAVSPQTIEGNLAITQDKKLTFPVLSDPGNEVARQFGIVFKFPEDLKGLYLKFGLDIAAANGDDSWTLPMPSRYIIDQNKVIQYAEIDPDYTIRPEPSHTIAALKNIAGWLDSCD
jgi:peroxiredoxin